MGLAICNKHGESGVVDGISLDVCLDLENHTATVKNIAIVVIEVFDDDEYLYSQKNYISEKLFIEKNLKKKYYIKNDTQEEILNKIFPRTSGVCGKCFKDYILRNGIIIEK